MSDAVQQIKDRLNIIDVVSPYVELHQAGKQFKGKSPFSNERTPSFHVSPAQGMYYCFSTNQGGDIFTFIQAMEGVDFKGALKILAEKANVELTPEAPGRKSERDRRYATLEAATAWFETKLATCPAAKQYLTERGVHPETITAWRIGYAPGPPEGGWRELRTALTEQGFTDAEMLAVGLIKQPDPNKDPFDVFRDRIMFPMPDTQGRVVAFSGRILHPSEKAPKYINSPETELYKKSELLFGYHKAKHHVRTIPFWLVAEGQFDVIMAHQAGYTNTVAVSGTALTLYHVQQLERLCTRVVLALDADRAGVAAMQKAATVMLARALDVKVAALPEGTDPADLAASDPAALKRYIGASSHVIEFLLGHLRAASTDDRTYKLRVREELLPFLILLPNKIDQDHFIGIVAERTGTSTDAIRHEVVRLAEQADVKATAPAKEGESRSTPAEPPAPTSVQAYSRRKELLTFLLAAQRVIPSAWAKRLGTLLEQELGAPLDTLEQEVVAERVHELLFIIERDFDAYKDRQQAEEVVDRLNQVRDLHLTEQLTACRTQLREAEQAGDEAMQQHIMETLQDLYVRRRQAPYSLEAIMTGTDPLD